MASQSHTLYVLTHSSLMSVQKCISLYDPLSQMTLEILKPLRCWQTQHRVYQYKKVRKNKKFQCYSFLDFIYKIILGTLLRTTSVFYIITFPQLFLCITHSFAVKENIYHENKPYFQNILIYNCGQQQDLYLMQN